MEHVPKHVLELALDPDDRPDRVRLEDGTIRFVQQTRAFDAKANAENALRSSRRGTTVYTIESMTFLGYLLLRNPAGIAPMNDIARWVSEHCSEKEEQAWLRGLDPRSAHVIGEVYCTLQGYDVPFLDASLTHYLSCHRRMEDASITTTFQRMTWQSTQQSFRFLELPAELRHKIYKMLLVFTTSWLELSYFSWNHRRFGEQSIQSYSTPRFDMMFSILAVNRQIYAEAYHIFYAENHFKLRDCEMLHRFLKGMSLSRRRELRHIAFSYAPWAKATARRFGPRALRLIADCESLLTLEIDCVNEAHWLNAGKNPLTKASSLPGIKALTKLHGLRKLTITGDNPLVKAYLKEHIPALED